jgi:hypothetical protein
MDKLIEDINDMSSRNALALLDEAINDTVDEGYTAAIVILARAGEVDENGECSVCITNAGMNGGEVIATLRAALVMFLDEAMGLEQADEDESDDFYAD